MENPPSPFRFAVLFIAVAGLNFRRPRWCGTDHRRHLMLAMAMAALGLTTHISAASARPG